MNTDNSVQNKSIRFTYSTVELSNNHALGNIQISIALSNQ